MPVARTPALLADRSAFVRLDLVPITVLTSALDQYSTL